MLSHIDEARSMRLRQRQGRDARALTLGTTEGGDDTGDDDKASGAADYMPAKGEKKRWAIPVIVGAAAGAAAVGLACMVTK